MRDRNVKEFILCAMVGIRSQIYPAIAHFILKETDMISKNITAFCINFQQIENYNAAINDKNETWHCHHRLELRDDYINTREELKMMNLYYDRPPEELIFMRSKDHMKLHQNHEKSMEHRRKKLLEYHHGPDWSEEDQENFVRKRNRRHCNKWRKQNRDKYNKVMRNAQDKWRAENPFYYRI